MKYDPRKCFGYPVLRSQDRNSNVGTDDYEGVAFQVNIEDLEVLQKERAVFSFDYSISLSLKALLEKISEGEAGYFLRIQCPDTYLSITREVKSSGSMEIPADSLRNEVQISCSVLAKKKTEVASDRINNEFGFKNFHVDQGQVLALSRPDVYYIEKELFRPILSMFEFVRDESLNKGEFSVRLEQEYVLIAVNEKQEKELKVAIAKGMSGQSIFLNSVAMSALTLMITLLRDEGQRGSYEDKKWAKVLMAKYPQWSNSKKGPLEVAQEIFNYPLQRLDSVFDEIRGDER